jgi:hypothetical protein
MQSESPAGKNPEVRTQCAPTQRWTLVLEVGNETLVQSESGALVHAVPRPGSRPVS